MITSNKVNLHIFVRYEFLMSVTMKITVIWDMTPCSLEEMYPYFKEPYCLLSQGQKIKVAYSSERLYTSTRIHGLTSDKKNL